MIGQRKGGTLHRWFKLESGTHCGWIKGDTHWPDGSALRTSKTIWSGFDILLTQNTEYTLGEKDESEANIALWNDYQMSNQYRCMSSERLEEYIKNE